MVNSSHADKNPIRLLTVVPLCDGHDSAIMTVNQALIREGFEVVYMGYHRAVQDIVRAALQEDVAAVGISSYNGGHIEFFRAVVHGLRAAGRGDIGVFGGGGGTITAEDVVQMKANGVDEVFAAGTSFQHTCERLRELYTGECGDLEVGETGSDVRLALRLSAAERMQADREQPPERGKAKVIGFTGPGGAGKTTLIDELIRGLLENGDSRIAVLSHDPSSEHVGGLLGDRATMVYSQNDHVFLRSMATRGQQGGLSPATEECLRWLVSAQAGFDYVFIETVGTGQEALPFESDLIDRKVLVLHPEYGARLQLQKILMLEMADLVVLNKADWAGATRASEELEAHLASRNVAVYQTTASKHRDAGVRALRKELCGE